MNPKVTISHKFITRAGNSNEFVGNSEDAREKLKGMAVSLSTKSGVRSGYLRFRDSRDGVTLGTNMFRRTGSTDTARDLVRSMIRSGYGVHPEVETAIDAYLAQSNERLGTQSFVKLIKHLESTYAPDDKDVYVSTSLDLDLHLAKPSINARLQTSSFRTVSYGQNADPGVPHPQNLLQETVDELPAGRSVANSQIEMLEHSQLLVEANPKPLDNMAPPELQPSLLQEQGAELSESKTVRQWAVVLGLGEDASAAEVLAALRKQDPEAARQVVAQLFSNAEQPLAKHPSPPKPGQINQVTDKYQLESKPDLSNSVTLLELGQRPVDLSELNLQGAHLLIRPRFNEFTTGMHWGVDLTGADLENTHIELDLSTGLKEKIDSGIVSRGTLAMGLLQNLFSGHTTGPGGGGVVGMIASIPSRFPALRVELTEQLLDFLNLPPSPAADGKLQWWPGQALSVLTLIDQFPELRDNPKITAAAKLFAKDIPKVAVFSTIMAEIKDPARPHPLIVRSALECCLDKSPEARKKFFLNNSEGINILLDHADRMDDSNPEALEVKRLASELEQAYLETEPFASLSKPFIDDDIKVRVLVNHDQKLNQTSALLIPSFQFQNMLINPGDVNWDILTASRFNPNDPLPPKLIESINLRADLPSLVGRFPAVKAAFDVKSTNAASRAISKLFEEGSEVQSMMAAYLDRGVRANALGPEEVSDVFSRALEPVHENFQVIYNTDRWSDARLKPEHLQQLLSLARAEGLGNNKMSFARYLFVLSASLLKMSSYKGYGSGDVSVISLRFYAYSLLEEAKRLAPLLPVGHDQTLENFQYEIRKNGCSAITSDDMIGAAKRNMPYSSFRVLPIHLASWAKNFELAKQPDENANLPAEVVY